MLYLLQHSKEQTIQEIQPLSETRQKTGNRLSSVISYLNSLYRFFSLFLKPQPYHLLYIDPYEDSVLLSGVSVLPYEYQEGCRISKLQAQPSTPLIDKSPVVSKADNFLAGKQAAPVYLLPESTGACATPEFLQVYRE